MTRSKATIMHWRALFKVSLIDVFLAYTSCLSYKMDRKTCCSPCSLSLFTGENGRRKVAHVSNGK